jgi:anaerobic selenocysteine-containing dehydrogenase
MVSVDMYITETSRHADYILPPCGPLQKDHYGMFFGPLAVRNYGSYSPALLDKSDGSKADWEIVAELATAILAAQGEPAPNIREPRDMLDDMLRASPAGMSLADVEAQPNGVDLGPLQPCLAARLRTDTKKIHAAPEPLLADLQRFAERMDSEPADSLRLIGRRHVRSNNSWLHNSRRLLKGPDRCTLMLHPDDAAARSLSSGDLAQVSSRVGSVTVEVEVTDDVMPGVASLPHGFGHGREGVKLSVAGAKPGVSLNDLTDPMDYDPLSGNAVLNGTLVTVAPSTVAPAHQMVAAE